MYRMLLLRWVTRAWHSFARPATTRPLADALVPSGPTRNYGYPKMSEHVYKTVEIVGSSATDMTDAMRTAVAKASETLRHIDWVEVCEIRGHVEDGQIAHFQVTMKLGFRLE
jgi:flavin-binding protein dodecin